MESVGDFGFDVFGRGGEGDGDWTGFRDERIYFLFRDVEEIMRRSNSGVAGEWDFGEGGEDVDFSNWGGGSGVGGEMKEYDLGEIKL